MNEEKSLVFTIHVTPLTEDCILQALTTYIFQRLDMCMLEASIDLSVNYNITTVIA